MLRNLRVDLDAPEVDDAPESLDEFVWRSGGALDTCDGQRDSIRVKTYPRRSYVNAAEN